MPNLAKMNSKALSDLANNASKSPTVRKNAQNVLRNRMFKAFRVVKEQRHLTAKERWTRAARRIRERGIVSAKRREILPNLIKYKRYETIARALRRINYNNRLDTLNAKNAAKRQFLSVGNRRALLRSVLNENIPYDPANVRRVLQVYHNRPNWVKQPMLVRNWVHLFSTNPNYNTIQRRLYGRL